MPFEYKPLTNNYVSLDEITEFITRLVFEAVQAQKTANTTGFFSKTKVVAQGDFFALQDAMLEFDSQITVNVDTPENREIVFNQRASNSITIYADIALEIENNELARRQLNKMVEYIERAICFNNCYYSNTLTTEQGFSGATYKSSLDKNKVQSVQKIDSQTQLQTNLTTQFKIEL